uniref:Uncharacterized protein n=1 Tax=Anopheles culicifacies TaxID=139723 RepID=A0A182LSG2_9DIPT
MFKIPPKKEQQQLRNLFTDEADLLLISKVQNMPILWNKRHVNSDGFPGTDSRFRSGSNRCHSSSDSEEKESLIPPGTARNRRNQIFQIVDPVIEETRKVKPGKRKKANVSVHTVFYDSDGSGGSDGYDGSDGSDGSRPFRMVPMVPTVPMVPMVPDGSGRWVQSMLQVYQGFHGYHLFNIRELSLVVQRPLSCNVPQFQDHSGCSVP